MKTLASLFVIVMIFAATAGYTQAPDSEQFLRNAQKSYMRALKSKNHGVRYSTIFLVVQFKKLHPEMDFKPFIKKFQRIRQSDPLLKNRLHAQLGIICLEQPGVMAAIDPNDHEDPKIFFNAIYAQLSEPRLALK